MFLVGYHQTPEPVDWHKLTYRVLTCRKTPINQSIMACGGSADVMVIMVVDVELLQHHGISLIN